MSTKTSRARNKPAASPAADASLTHVTLPIDEVLDDPANENIHPPEQIERLRASIRLYGQQDDILIDRRNVCVAGHGVKQAMKLEGKPRISCKYTDLVGADRAGYRIASNVLARLSHLDEAIMRANIIGIREEKGEAFNPDMLGMGEIEFQHAVSSEWNSRSKIDPEMIGDYNQDHETVLIKIPNVKATHKDEIMSRLTSALEGTEYAATAY